MVRIITKTLRTNLDVQYDVCSTGPGHPEPQKSRAFTSTVWVISSHFLYNRASMKTATEFLCCQGATPLWASQKHERRHLWWYRVNRLAYIVSIIFVLKGKLREFYENCQTLSCHEWYMYKIMKVQKGKSFLSSNCIKVSCKQIVLIRGQCLITGHYITINI